MFQIKALLLLSMSISSFTAVLVMAGCGNNKALTDNDNSADVSWSHATNGLRLRLTTDNTNWDLHRNQDADQSYEAISVIRAEFENISGSPIRLLRLAPQMVRIQTRSGVPVGTVPHMLGWLCHPITETDFPQVEPGHSVIMELCICPVRKATNEAMIYDPRGSCAALPDWFKLSVGRYKLCINYSNADMVQTVQGAKLQGIWTGRIESNGIPIVVVGE
jgi:hypothetical protein